MGPSPYFTEKKPRRRSKRLPEFALVALLSVMAGVVIANGSTILSGITSSLPLSTISGNEGLSGTARIIDGDTLVIEGIRVRLVGIDAPEMDQSCVAADGQSYACGARAKSHLAALAGHMSIRCDGNEKDRYHRLLATCYAGEVNLNAEMVRSGWAVSFRRYSKQYLPEEQIAKASALGLWQGDFRLPWTWRQGKHTASVDGRNCDIKGNISKNGKIYHLPGSRWYSATQIDEKKGERWFCSESDALAAGWRSPRYD